MTPKYPEKQTLHMSLTNIVIKCCIDNTPHVLV